MEKLTLAKFEAERKAGVKCVNVHCEFCMDELDVICDAEDVGGDPSYANCLTYLPEKLIKGESVDNTQQLKAKIRDLANDLCKFSQGLNQEDDTKLVIHVETELRELSAV